MKTVAENFKIIRTLPVRDREAEKSVGFTYRWEAFSFVLWLSHYSPENIQTLFFQHPTTPFRSRLGNILKYMSVQLYQQILSFNMLHKILKTKKKYGLKVLEQQQQKRNFDHTSQKSQNKWTNIIIKMPIKTIFLDVNRNLQNVRISGKKLKIILRSKPTKIYGKFLKKTLFER